ncbi:MAG: hypothetical protein AAGI06_03400 [Pseudomonadota bacterium]
MQNDNQPNKSDTANQPGFLMSLIQGGIRDTMTLWISVLIGTIVGAGVCLYLGAPLIFSLVGGLLVMAVYVGYVKI